MSICEKCKHAEWLLTANGRKHPSGQGQCHWTKTVRVPAHYSQFYSDARGKPLTIGSKPAFIWRNKDGFSRCDVFEKDATP